LQVAGALNLLGGLLRDGEDKIVHKPISIAEGSNPLSIGHIIINALASAPTFDVKYVAVTPLIGLVWAKTRNLFSRILKRECVDEDNLLFAWAPMAVFFGELIGFSSSPQEVVSEMMSNRSLRRDVTERLQDEIDRNQKRWKGLGVTAEDVINMFLESANKSNCLIQCRSIELWLMYVIERSPGEMNARKSFEDDLVKLFGGETRLSIGAKGGWFDGAGAFVTDVPLIIEFCAKQGLIARKAIKKIVAQYLTQEGCEEMVLIQEIPIKGYMLSR
jgi:hypothetical protein